MSFIQELDALQRWIFQASGLSSYRLGHAPPKLARPVIVWEPAARQATRNISRWQYIKPVTQYGKLYVANLSQLMEYQARLEQSLEELLNIPVYDKEGIDGQVVGHLREVQLLFDQSDQTLDVLMRVSYEATYRRERPVYPAPTEVYQRVVTPDGEVKTEE